ncbi:MAG: hypothetical protein Q9227_003484 [Pyrenula ochraceoflavens]
MPFNALTVGAAVTPTVIATYFSHYLNRKPLRRKPTAHISYHEGLKLIREFLQYASHHTVEDLQGFTSQWVPHPTWVRVESVTVPEQCLSDAAQALIAQLGPHGINKVGGSKWWQWRKRGTKLDAEWIEMRSDYLERKRLGKHCKRVMLYVHGGAYFFGSTDEHRYQMQRHARKLKARVFAPRYRLAPQFPFPCGLFDCLSAYLHLLTVQEPTEIILAGDSAGAGMVVSILVTLRDRGLPLPAGAILISPWVDLTHSFPSVAGGNEQDYIPGHGFHQRPSSSWPPPNEDEIEAIAKGAVLSFAGSDLPRKSTQEERQNAESEAVQGFAVYDASKAEDPEFDTSKQISVMIDGALVVLKDQIQMYATNSLINHPLVSPVLQPSLGGLPPLLILTGGGEMLRDEQIYLAHKAANPSKYPASDLILDEHDPDRSVLNKFKPTYVQLQVWDDLCHVAPTLSFTRPAKFMYRSIAQFGAWALARAQKTAIEILDDDNVSVISSGSSTGTESSSEDEPPPKAPATAASKVPHSRIGRAGDPIPPFQSHMVRQCVDRHGEIYALPAPSELPGCQLPPDQIGVPKEGPVRKWLAAKKTWNTRYAREKRRVQKQRIADMVAGYEGFGEGEVPPPSALAGRRKKGDSGDSEIRKKKKKSYGMMLWSLWGSKHDKSTLEREEEMEKEAEKGHSGAENVTEGSGDAIRPLGRRSTIVEGRETRAGVVVDTIAQKQATPTTTPQTPKIITPAEADSSFARPMHSRSRRKSSQSHSRSRRRTVTDTGQTENENLTLDQLRAEQNMPPPETFAGDGAMTPTVEKPQNKLLTLAGISDTASIKSAQTSASTQAVIGAAGVLHDTPTTTTNRGTISRTNTAEGDGIRPETPPSRGSLVRLQVSDSAPGGEGVEAGKIGEKGEERGRDDLVQGVRARSSSATAVVGSEGVVGKVSGQEKVNGAEGQQQRRENGNAEKKMKKEGFDKSEDDKGYGAARYDLVESSISPAQEDHEGEGEGEKEVENDTKNKISEVVGQNGNLELRGSLQTNGGTDNEASAQKDSRRPGMYDRGDSEFQTAREG